MVFPWGIVALTGAAASAWIVLAYVGVADRKGWPTGEWFRSDTSMLKIASMFGLPLFVISAWYLGVWWHSLVVLIAGLLLGSVLTNIFRRHIQVISIIGLASGWIICVMMLARV